MPALPPTAPPRGLVVLGALHHALSGRQQPAPSTTQRAPRTLVAIAALPKIERQALAYCSHGRATISQAAALLGEQPRTINLCLGRALRQLQINREVATLGQLTTTLTGLLASTLIAPE